jgi:hypothetical protein
MSERGCFNCGAILGGYGVRIAGETYCSRGCFLEATEDDEDDDSSCPEEDRPPRYDTTEERDIDLLDCPESEYDE